MERNRKRNNTVVGSQQWAVVDAGIVQQHCRRTVNKKSEKIIMKKFLTIIMLCGICYGYAQNTPPYASSTQTWNFGGLIWSDAIQMPECDKSSFEDSYTKPQCRSYTFESNKYYYYNWAYVSKNAWRMCAKPWRVPTEDDLIKASKDVDRVTLKNAWGLSGYALTSSMNRVGSYGACGSSTEYEDDFAYFLGYDSSGLSVDYTSKSCGFPTRCVQ
jgi:hypothetical protein